jgi:protein SCO1/2
VNKRALVILSVLVQPLALSSLAVAHDGVASESAAPSPPAGDDEILAPPPTYKANDVKVDEKLGARVPLDVKFRQHDGNVVTLGHVLQPFAEPGKLVTAGANDLPTIITFNYSECPMLCNLQLNGLTAALPKIAERKDGAMFRLGDQFRIVTIDLEPNEDLAKLTAFREKYIERLPESQRASARKGWTFLAAEHPGDAASIRRVAQAVGFSYTYVTERAEWAHPAALIFLSTTGTVTRYVYGIEFEEAVMRESILKAGASEPSSAIGFMNRCYHYDPDANNHSRAGVLALRIGAAGCVILLLSGLGIYQAIRKNRPVLEVKGNRS